MQLRVCRSGAENQVLGTPASDNNNKKALKWPNRWENFLQRKKKGTGGRTVLNVFQAPSFPITGYWHGTSGLKWGLFFNKKTLLFFFRTRKIYPTLPSWAWRTDFLFLLSTYGLFSDLFQITLWGKWEQQFRKKTSRYFSSFLTYREPRDDLFRNLGEMSTLRRGSVTRRIPIMHRTLPSLHHA